MKLVTGTLNFLWILPLILSEDIPVTCFYSEECMLPCQSTYHNIIHWYKGQKAVHSFYQGKDQLSYQDQEYKARTSLPSPSQINEGNASLLLKNIRIKDEGKYKCYAASETLNEEKYVVVSVVAPVKSVDITIRNDTVTCSTTGVYPEPKVVWPLQPSAKNQTNNVRQTDEKLFVLTSELQIGNINDVYTFNCSIKNSKGQTLYEAILKQEEISVEEEFTLPCPFTQDKSFSLIFSTTVLTHDSKNSDQQIPDDWKDKVSFQPADGTVKLHNLNKEHIGNYICKTTTAQYTLTSTKNISGNEGTFRCPVTKEIYKTILIFHTNVLEYDNHNLKKPIPDQWTDKITLPSEHNGAVKLACLNQKQHSGTYTCDSTTVNTRYIIHTTVTLTGGKVHTALAIVLPLLIIVVFSVVFGIFLKKKKLCCNKRPANSTSTSHGDSKDFEQQEPLSNGTSSAS